MSTGLPDGFEIVVRDDVRVLDRGRILIGGSPTRVARLTDAGAALVDGGRLRVTDAASRVLADRLLESNFAVPVPPPLPSMNAAELTVVIPVYGRVEQLDRLLAGLGTTLPCIVVDDASSAPEMIAKVARRHHARLVVQTHNAGPAAARNAGFLAARTPYVVFVDSDITADPVTLLRLLAHFNDPRVSAVAPRVRGIARGGRGRWFQRYDEVSQSLDLGERSSLVRPASAVSWLPAACLVVRSCDFGEGFDESLRVAEDVDLVWRLVAEHRRVRYDAEAEVRHDSRATFRNWLGRKAYYGTGCALLEQRHGNLVAPAVLSPAYAVAAATLLTQRPWSAPVVLLCTSFSAVRIRRSLPLSSGRTREAGRLASRGLLSAVAQTGQLMLRHWWPVAAAASIALPSARRAVAAAVIMDMVLTPPPEGTSRFTLVVPRRLDDLAYGAGLWLGALRARSTKALRVRVVRA